MRKIVINQLIHKAAAVLESIITPCICKTAFIIEKLFNLVSDCVSGFSDATASSGCLLASGRVTDDVVCMTHGSRGGGG